MPFRDLCVPLPEYAPDLVDRVAISMAHGAQLVGMLSALGVLRGAPETDRECTRERGGAALGAQVSGFSVTSTCACGHRKAHRGGPAVEELLWAHAEPRPLKELDVWIRPRNVGHRMAAVA